MSWTVYLSLIALCLTNPVLAISHPIGSLIDLAKNFRGGISLEMEDSEMDHSVYLRNLPKATKEEFVKFLEECEEAEKELEEGGYRQGKTLFFSGSHSTCRKDKIKNCCTTGSKGLLDKHPLKKCSKKEAELVGLLKKSRCKKLGKRRGKKHFCCFRSQKEREMIAACKKQLGLSWGTLKEPDCRGLFIEEAKRLDLDALAQDLSLSSEEVIEMFFVDRERTKEFLDTVTVEAESAKERLKRDGWM